jgi:hypothetical protein
LLANAALSKNFLDQQPLMQLQLKLGESDEESLSSNVIDLLEL